MINLLISLNTYYELVYLLKQCSFHKKSFELNQNALNFKHSIFFIYSAQIGHNSQRPAAAFRNKFGRPRNLI